METCRGFLICRVPPIHHRCHLNRCGVSPGNPNKPRAIRGRRLSGLIALGILPASCCGQAGTHANGSPPPMWEDRKGMQ